MIFPDPLLPTGGTGEHPLFIRDLNIVLLVDFGKDETEPDPPIGDPPKKTASFPCSETTACAAG